MFSIPNFIKVAGILAVTRIRRTSFIASALIVLIMTLTFLNLLVIRGILIGLPTGAINANEEKYYSDVYISALDSKKHIDNYRVIIDEINRNSNVAAFSLRYLTAVTVRAEIDSRISSDEELNQVASRIWGVDLAKENAIISLEDNIARGRFFDKDSIDEVVIGADLVSNFERGEAIGNQTLDNIDIGNKVLLSVGSKSREAVITGFVQSKVGEIDGKVLVSQKLFKELTERDDFKPDIVVVKVRDEVSPKQLQKELVDSGLGRFASIETSEEYQPSFVDDLVNTFSILGDVIGTISLAVAAITVFIVIFVNALTQRKSIGILKGIGISLFSIELSYILQALLYVLLGALISIPLLYLVLVPYFAQNPIDFPFADGILVAEISQTVSRTAILFLITALAGYLPARYIVKQNTLDAILGR